MTETESGLPHLRLVNSERSYSYTPRGGGGAEYSRPPRDRDLHARKLAGDLEKTEADALARGYGESPDRILAYDLQPGATPLVDSLERIRSGIELLAGSCGSDDLGDRMPAQVEQPASQPSG